MMDNNYTYSKELLHFSIEQSIPFIYASSAAVYGINTSFAESAENERPINVYGYSKLLFDNYVRTIDATSQVVGLRYFNVYGPGEAHKQSMASVAYHLNNQMNECETVKLFAGSHEYSDGEQRRDFIYINDVVKVNLWMMQHTDVSGIFNLGTGEAHAFNKVAEAVIDWHGKGCVEYIPFPESLKNSYQAFTEADIRHLRSVGYKEKFTPLNKGVHAYLDSLNS